MPPRTVAHFSIANSTVHERKRLWRTRSRDKITTGTTKRDEGQAKEREEEKEKILTQ